MCGLSVITGQEWSPAALQAMIAVQSHRGPDGTGFYLCPSGKAGLGHNRLKIIDLSDAGRQPMSTPDGRYWLVFNGEIYNYRELRDQLSDYPFRSRTDTEVLLAAWQRWGADCLNRLLGMFAFAIWDERLQRLFAARDRFGVKPLYYSLQPDGGLVMASEIKALQVAGVTLQPDAATWATYLATGAYDHSQRTFWSGISALPAGHLLDWCDGESHTSRWYDLAERVGTEYDERPEVAVRDEYHALLRESLQLRFRSDVPVGINLSGGLDSSVLLAAVCETQPDNQLQAFTFATGDARYDETPWVQQMLLQTGHESIVCRLSPQEVPALAESVQEHQDEPFGGLPTIAYARLFEEARRRNVIVLLDGQGMDEQWAGYDYYHTADAGVGDQTAGPSLIQGTRESSTRPDCLVPAFRELATPVLVPRQFPDELRNTQYRDARFTKLPRALRFNDRVSMQSSTELREPFLDHRMFELAMRQRPERKISSETGKVLLRRLARQMLPGRLIEAPKRPLQTPQREWLRGPLRDWAGDWIHTAVARYGGEWIDPVRVREHWTAYQSGRSDNSFYVWQWISLGFLSRPVTSSRPSRDTRSRPLVTHV